MRNERTNTTSAIMSAVADCRANAPKKISERGRRIIAQAASLRGMQSGPEYTPPSLRKFSWETDPDM